MTTPIKTLQLELPEMAYEGAKLPSNWAILTQKDHNKAGRMHAVKRPPKKK